MNFQPKSSGASDRIALVEPDPTWPSQYDAEANELRLRLPVDPAVRVEHFGSTAVPGIRAKPIIDILIIHPETALWPALIQPIASHGYVYWAGNPRKDRMFFVKGMPPYGIRRTHHLHVRTPADAEAELAFRDRMRASPKLARRYEALKEDLARRHPDDREAYTGAKSGFVAEVLGA